MMKKPKKNGKESKNEPHAKENAEKVKKEYDESVNGENNE